MKKEKRTIQNTVVSVICTLLFTYILFFREQSATSLEHTKELVVGTYAIVGCIAWILFMIIGFYKKKLQQILLFVFVFLFGTICTIQNESMFVIAGYAILCIVAYYYTLETWDSYLCKSKNCISILLFCLAFFSIINVLKLSFSYTSFQVLPLKEWLKASFIPFVTLKRSFGGSAQIEYLLFILLPLNIGVVWQEKARGYLCFLPMIYGRLMHDFQFRTSITVMNQILIIVCLFVGMIYNVSNWEEKKKREYLCLSVVISLFYVINI
ncbi:MAG: hypothetical protein ACRC7V_09660 [Lachnospiraceae bacterium]